MNREEQIDMFMTLLRGERERENNNLIFYLDKIQNNNSNKLNEDDIKNYKKADIRYDTYDHIIDVAKTCFKL